MSIWWFWDGNGIGGDSLLHKHCHSLVHCMACCRLAKGFGSDAGAIWQGIEDKYHPGQNNERNYWCSFGLQAATMGGSCLTNCTHLAGSIYKDPGYLDYQDPNDPDKAIPSVNPMCTRGPKNKLYLPNPPGCLPE
jgi:hypothetical protein